MASRSRPDRIHASRDGSSMGKSGVFCRSPSPRPASARVLRAVSRWNGSPRWLAQASASCSGVGSQPACSRATACSGLFEDRGKTRPSASPSTHSGRPVGRREHDAGAVHALDDPAAHDVREDGRLGEGGRDGRGGGGRGLGHGEQCPSTGRPDGMGRPGGCGAGDAVRRLVSRRPWRRRRRRPCARGRSSSWPRWWSPWRGTGCGRRSSSRWSSCAWPRCGCA